MKKVQLILVLFLAASLAANFLIYDKSKSLYRTFNQLRLAPLSLNSHPIPKEPIETLIFGDSHAQKWNPAPESDILNLGIGGQTSQQLHLRALLTFEGLQVETAIIFAGGNDLKAIASTPHLEKSVLNNAYMNLMKTIEAIGAKRTILCTIPPVFSIPLRYRFFDYQSSLRALEDLNDQIRNTQQPGITVFDANQILTQHGDLNELSEDGIHLNPKGYELLNDHVAKLLMVEVSLGN